MSSLEEEDRKTSISIFNGVHNERKGEGNESKIEKIFLKNSKKG